MNRKSKLIISLIILSLGLSAYTLSLSLQLQDEKSISVTLTEENKLLVSQVKTLQELNRSLGEKLTENSLDVTLSNGVKDFLFKAYLDIANNQRRRVIELSDSYFSNQLLPKANYKTKDFVGFWHIADSVASTSMYSFHLFEDQTFIASHNGYLSHLSISEVVYTKGQWKIEKGVLVVTIEEEYYRDGGELKIDSSLGFLWSDSQIKYRKLKEPRKIAYIITENDYDSGDLRTSKSFSGIKLYKLNSDPDIYLDHFYNLEHN